MSLNRQLNYSNIVKNIVNKSGMAGANTHTYVNIRNNLLSSKHRSSPTNGSPSQNSQSVSYAICGWSVCGGTDICGI